MLHNVLTVVLCGRRNTVVSFQENELHFSWQAQHFGDLHHHFAWEAQRFRRVVLRVFGESHCRGCVKWLVTTYKFRGRRGFL